jgi:hypothetical protein
MQIIKRHAGAILLGRTRLSWAQRYQFLSGWLPWISDALGMIVTFMALIWTTAMWVSPQHVYPPMPALSAAALALFFAKTFKTFLLYPPKVRSGVKGALMASVAGLALTHSVAKAVIAGLFTSGRPFLRTPKCEDPALLSQALRVVWQETTLFCLCAASVMSVWLVHGFEEPPALLWMFMLTVQSVPYLATVVTACLSAVSNASRAVTVIAPAPPPELKKAA